MSPVVVDAEDEMRNGVPVQMLPPRHPHPRHPGTMSPALYLIFRLGLTFAAVSAKIIIVFSQKI